MSSSPVFARIALDLADCDHCERGLKRWQAFYNLMMRFQSKNIYEEVLLLGSREWDVHTLEVQRASSDFEFGLALKADAFFSPRSDYSLRPVMIISIVFVIQ